MKHTSALLAIAIPATASVVKRQATCVSGTYRCTTPTPSGIEVCNVQGRFVLVGACPSGTTCQLVSQVGGSTFPACLTIAVPGGACTTPGRYECFGTTTIAVCNAQKTLQSVGTCPSGTHCGTIGGVPFCLNN